MKRKDFIKTNGILISGYFIPIKIVNFYTPLDPKPGDSIKINIIRDKLAFSMPYAHYSQRTKDKIASFQRLLIFNDYYQEHKNDRNIKRAFREAKEIVYDSYELDKNDWKELIDLFSITKPDLFVLGEFEKNAAQGVFLLGSAAGAFLAPETAFALAIGAGIGNQTIETWNFQDISKGVLTDDDYYDSVFERAGTIVMNKLLTNEDPLTNNLLRDTEFRYSIGLPISRSNNDIIDVAPPAFQKLLKIFLTDLQTRGSGDIISRQDFKTAITTLQKDMLNSIKMKFDEIQKKQEFMNDLIEMQYEKQAKSIAFKNDLNYKIQEAKGLIEISAVLIGIEDPQVAAKVKSVLSSALNITQSGILLAAKEIGPLAFTGVLFGSLFSIFSNEGQEIMAQISELKDLINEVQNNLRNLILQVALRIERKLDVIYNLDLEIYKLLKEFAEKSLTNDAIILQEITELNRKIDINMQSQINDSRKLSFSQYRTELETLPVNLRISNEEYEKNLIILSNKCSEAYLSYFNGNLDGTSDSTDWIKINMRMENLGELTYSFGLIEILGSNLKISTGKMPNPKIWFERCYNFLEGRILNITHESSGLTSKTKELYNETLRIQKSLVDLTKKDNFNFLIKERKKIFGITDLDFEKDSIFLSEIKNIITESIKKMDLIFTNKIKELEASQEIFRKGRYIIDNAINGKPRIYLLEDNFDFIDILIQKKYLRKYNLNSWPVNYGTLNRYTLCLEDEKYSSIFYPFAFIRQAEKPDGCVTVCHEYKLTNQGTSIPFGRDETAIGTSEGRMLSFEAGSIIHEMDLNWKEFGLISNLIDDVNSDNYKFVKEKLSEKIAIEITNSKLFEGLVKKLNENSIKLRMFFSLLCLKRNNSLNNSQIETRLIDYPLPLASLEGTNLLLTKSIDTFFQKHTEIKEASEISNILVEDIAKSIVLELKYILDNFENIYLDINEETSLSQIDYLVSTFRGYIKVNNGYT